MAETVDFTLLAQLGQQTLAELRALRQEVNQIRRLTLQTIDYSRRVERRLNEQRDDLELMIKAELGGALANMQTHLDNAIHPLETRYLSIDALEQRLDALERRP